MRIPYDSFTMWAVVAEAQTLVGARVQKVSQPTAESLIISLYRGREHHLLLDCHPEHARAHLTATRRKGADVGAFALAVRSRLDGAILKRLEQVRFDRILMSTFVARDGEYNLIAELMGKHSNLILVSEDQHVVSCARLVGRAKSKRPILPGRPYSAPPVEVRRPIFEAGPGEDLRQFEGASPFLVRLIEAGGLVPIQVAQSLQPVISHGNGAYPISVAALGLPEEPRDSINEALDGHFGSEIPRREAEALRSTLVVQLERARLAKEVALSDLDQAADAAARAGGMQRQGELILAYASTIAPGARELNTQDYDGRQVTVLLDPDLGPLENAQRLFDRAKRAKSGAEAVAEQQGRMAQAVKGIVALLARATAADTLDDLLATREEARQAGWLREQAPHQTSKEDRPFGGHRIRTVLGPQGHSILHGETATANDYLTTRVARPNDLWLHVRAGVSAHVVIQTGNRPERVALETLLFAARIAVQNSPQKHSGYVPVDYTLRKHVRKPRGSPPGSVVYSREKTLHIER